jgi:hypothetical protein
MVSKRIQGVNYDGTGARLGTATERVPDVSGREASWKVHYALTFLPLIETQATACGLNAAEVSPGVVN